MKYMSLEDIRERYEYFTDTAAREIAIQIHKQQPVSATIPCQVACYIPQLDLETPEVKNIIACFESTGIGTVFASKENLQNIGIKYMSLEEIRERYDNFVE